MLPFHPLTRDPPNPRNVPKKKRNRPDDDHGFEGLQAHGDDLKFLYEKSSSNRDAEELHDKVKTVKKLMGIQGNKLKEIKSYLASNPPNDQEREELIKYCQGVVHNEKSETHVKKACATLIRDLRGNPELAGNAVFDVFGANGEEVSRKSTDELNSEYTRDHGVKLQEQLRKLKTYALPLSQMKELKHVCAVILGKTNVSVLQQDVCKSILHEIEIQEQRLNEIERIDFEENAHGDPRDEEGARGKSEIDYL